MFKLTDEQIEKAAQWWADRVCAPTFSGLSNEERRDPRSRGYQVGEIMAAMLTKPVATDERERFVAALKEELQAEDYNPHFGLNVDYHPCSTLQNAAKKASIPLENFPWKTYLVFGEGGIVKAASGYGTTLMEL